MDVALAVRPVTATDVAHVSLVLARAFHGDPLHRWIFPTERAWAGGSQRSFAIAIRQELRRGTVFMDGAGRGAAIWHEPAVTRSLWERVSFAARMLPLLDLRAMLVGRGFDRLERLHPREPHWYLYAVGTDPGQWLPAYAPELDPVEWFLFRSA